MTGHHNGRSATNQAMRYWLMKSEPGEYSIDDLARDGVTHWDGVRNYQARNLMRDDMEVGDRVLFYHSNAKPPAVVGIAEVARPAYPDHTQFDQDSNYFDPDSTKKDPRWYMVDIKLVKIFNNQVTLKQIKENPKLKNFRLIQRGNRLSVFPVTKDEWDEILKIAS